MQTSTATIDSILDFEASLNWESPYLDWQTIQTEIEQGFLGYVKAGLCLERVRYLKLYKESGFKTFQDYCQKKLRLSVGYTHQIIQAAKVALNLIHAGFNQLPNCVAQALQLIKYNTIDPYGNCPLVEKWQQILAAIPPGIPITAAKIGEILEGPKDKPKNLKIRQDTYHRLKAVAERQGKTVDDLIDSLLDDWEEGETPEPVPPEKEQAWEEDLKKLVLEHAAIVEDFSRVPVSSSFRGNPPRPDSS